MLSARSVAEAGTCASGCGNASGTRVGASRGGVVKLSVSHSIEFSGDGPSSLPVVLKFLGLPPCCVLHSKDPITWGAHASHNQTATRKPDHHHRFSERSDLLATPGR